jgi:hypothetical protein
MHTTHLLTQMHTEGGFGLGGGGGGGSFLSLCQSLSQQDQRGRWRWWRGRKSPTPPCSVPFWRAAALLTHAPSLSCRWLALNRDRPVSCVPMEPETFALLQIDDAFGPTYNGPPQCVASFLPMPCLCTLRCSSCCGSLACCTVDASCGILFGASIFASIGACVLVSLETFRIPLEERDLSTLSCFLLANPRASHPV